GQCRVLTDTNFDEMTYVHLLEILKRLVPNGFEKIDMYVDYFGYDIMEMVEWDRNEEMKKSRIKSESDSSDDDYHYSDDDLEEIKNVDFHTEGDDSVVIKNIATQDPFLTKLCSVRVLFKGNIEYEVNEETPQVDPDDNQIDHVYKGQCRVLTDTNFDEMTYVHLLEILKRLVPNGFKKVYYYKTGAKLTSIREIKSDQDIVDLLKIDMYVDHFGYDIMEMVKWDRNEEMRKTRIKSEPDSSDDDYNYSDDDLEEIENVDFHTEGDDSVMIKNIATQDPFLSKLCSVRILFKGNVEYEVNEETPQVDPYDN
nr:hypothetical protein [Tanacetum cinerariifolium]